MKPDENYIRKVDELIPLAEKAANDRIKGRKKMAVVAGVDGMPYKWDYWTQYFHEEMNRLADERRLRCWQGIVKH